MGPLASHAPSVSVNGKARPLPWGSAAARILPTLQRTPGVPQDIVREIARAIALGWRWGVMLSSTGKVEIMPVANGDDAKTATQFQGIILKPSVPGLSGFLDAHVFAERERDARDMRSITQVLDGE